MSDFKTEKVPNSISAGAPPQTPLGELAALPRLPADLIPALGPPGLETTCLPKYLSLNTPMRVVNFLLVLIELFSLGVTTEELRANIDWKSAISLQWGPFHPKFQVEGVAPTNHFFLRKLGKVVFRMV